MAPTSPRATRSRAVPRGGRPRRTEKGERTANRILDAAERLFAERGFEAASLREIARLARVQEPGVYHYFASKQALYRAVLDRALDPMLEAMRAQARSRDGALELPAVMTDILLEHPTMAALFQRALQGDGRSPGDRMVRRWLARLFGEALETLAALGHGARDRHELAIQVIAMFNLTTGYFLAQPALDAMRGGRIDDPALVARQKALLRRMVRASLPA